VPAQLPDPRQAEISTELQQVDARLDQLQHERAQLPIVGPVVMLAVGYGTAAVSSIVAIAMFAGAEEIEDGSYLHDGDWDDDDLDVDNDGRIDGDDERSLRNTARVFTAFAGVGLGFGIAGSVLLAKRNQKRNVHKGEITELKQRRRELVRSLRYGAQLNADRLDLSVAGRF
jgi:hypothetical protein